MNTQRFLDVLNARYYCYTTVKSRWFLRKAPTKKWGVRAMVVPESKKK